MNVVFLGPTLPLADARALCEAVYLPPARRGEVLAAVERYAPTSIALIDGYFDQVPSVWHKEILFALHHGIKVAGAASMGALRAAELGSFGMMGIGRVFEAYATGRFSPFELTFEDDDEVAVAHGPAETGYASTVAMVDIRATLASAVEQHVLSIAEAEAMAAVAKSLFYKDRTYARLLAGAAAGGLGPELLELVPQLAAQWAGHAKAARRRGAPAPSGGRIARGRAAHLSVRADAALGKRPDRARHWRSGLSFSLDTFFRPTGTRFRLFPQSPVLQDFHEPEIVYVSSPAGSLGPGPSDNRMYALSPIDKKPYGDADLPPFRGPMDLPALPDSEGHFDYLQPDDPGFKAAHMFGTVRRVLDVWEVYLGGPLHWHFASTHPRLEMIPHVAWDNAHFGWGFMECGEGSDDEGQKRPYALNFDILAHETGHGIVFSLAGVPTPETLTTAYRGFHESASDCVAMLSALHFDSFVAHVLRVTEGDIYLANELNRIGELSATRQIRSASNALRMSDVISLDTPPDKVKGKEAHTLGQPLTGAIFDIIVDFYLERLVAFRLVDRTLVDALRLAARDDKLAEADDSPLRDAYASEPEGFHAALCDARDMVGLRFAATLHRLQAANLTFARVGSIFLDIDRQLSGAANQAMVLESFAWREILSTSDSRRETVAHRPAMV